MKFLKVQLAGIGFWSMFGLFIGSFFHAPIIGAVVGCGIAVSTIMKKP